MRHKRGLAGRIGGTTKNKVAIVIVVAIAFVIEK